MLPKLFRHKQYVRFVRHRVNRYSGLRRAHRDYKVWRKLSRTNLDGAYPVVAELYESGWGRPARDPVSMLRSCLAMMLCGETSVDEWVKQMRDEPFYALMKRFRAKQCAWRRHVL